MPEPETPAVAEPPDWTVLPPILHRHAPAGRSALLPALLEVQTLYGHVPQPAGEARTPRRLGIHASGRPGLLAAHPPIRSFTSP